MKIISVLAALTFAALIIIKPELCAAGAAEGILLCGRVLIPSLFPMTVCTLFITGSGAFSGLKRLSAVTQKLFHLSSGEFITVVLSLIGGYPVGAKLLNEAVKENRHTPRKSGAYALLLRKFGTRIRRFTWAWVCIRQKPWALRCLPRIYCRP